MKKYLSTILTIPALILGGIVMFLPHTAHAIDVMGYILDTVPTQWITGPLAYIANSVLSLTSWFVTISGTFLNISLYTTTHIRDLVSQVGAVNSVWVTIRDLSSLVIIFMLLYSAIKMIVGADTAGFGKLVVKIFVAGILINFSLFFIRVGVDISNIVSLQFYSAIAPQQSYLGSANGGVSDSASAFYDGGISNIFANSLQINTIFQTTGVLKAVDVSLAIFIAAAGGIVMLIIASMSFMAASVAFTVRTAIILFCMAISPVLFLTALFPALPGKKVWDILKGQLIFMPVYMALMYVALRIISDPNFLGAFGASNAPQNEAFGAVSISIIIQFIIAIAFINAPLVIAMSLRGTVPGVDKLTKTITGAASGWIGRNTAGRYISNVLKPSKTVERITARMGASKNSALRALSTTAAVKGINNAAKKAEGMTYGGKKTFKEIQKENRALQNKYATDHTLNKVLAKKKTDNAGGEIDGLDADESKAFGKTIDNLSTEKLVELGMDQLKKPLLLGRLSSKKFDSLVDDKQVDLTNDEKDELKTKRKEVLAENLNRYEGKALKELMKKLSGNELLKISDKKVIKQPKVMNILTPSQLEEMDKADDFDIADRKEIANYIIEQSKTGSPDGRIFFLDNKKVQRWGAGNLNNGASAGSTTNSSIEDEPWL